MYLLRGMIGSLVVLTSLAVADRNPSANRDEALRVETEEYSRDCDTIVSRLKSLKAGRTNDLVAYEDFANGIQNKWKSKGKENYARLMLGIAGPLSSRQFNDRRQYELARIYALSALAEPNQISLEVELELVGHVMTNMVGAPVGDTWTQQRKRDIEVRLHAWKRLTDTIDPNWNANDVPFINVTLPPGVEGLAGMAPEGIKDLTQRTQYEEAIKRNTQKAKNYHEQYSGASG